MILYGRPSRCIERVKLSFTLTSKQYCVSDRLTLFFFWDEIPTLAVTNMRMLKSKEF